jgi:hypothetical protein
MPFSAETFGAPVVEVDAPRAPRRRGQSVHAYYRSLSESEVGRGCAGLMFEWNCSLHVGEAPV